MARFSPSDAAYEGFRVLQAHWRVVVGWALFNLVAEVAMVVVTVVVALAASAVAGTTSGAASAIGGMVWALGGLVIATMLVTGLFRLMLRPNEPGFLHLRLGIDELRLLAVWGVMALAVFLLIGICAVAQRFAGRAAIAVWLATGLVGLWLGLRFALTPVASFADRRLGFRTSWATTRGQVWSLLGMSVLAACFIGLIVLVTWLIVALVVGLTAGFGTLVQSFGDTEALKAHPALYLGQAAVELVLSPVLMVLAAAPQVAAWRALSDDPDRPRGPWDLS